MELADLEPAIQHILDHPIVADLRGRTYLATYPSILTIGGLPGEIDLDRLHQLATMTYGWMPRIVRIDPQHIENALEAFQQAQAAHQGNMAGINFNAIANCLHSVVGASKILHFVNPIVFPIWDSNIEQFRLNAEAPDNHMRQVANYLEYVNEVHGIQQDNHFPAFFTEFNTALGERLEANNIARYQVSEVRAIESAAFELAL